MQDDLSIPQPAGYHPVAEEAIGPAQIVFGVPLDVLAIGDSWTEGYCAGGQSWHPYAASLEQLLHGRNPSSKVWLCTPSQSICFLPLPPPPPNKVASAGVSGDTTAFMLERLLRTLREEEGKQRHFSHIIIFGGREDIQRYLGCSGKP